MAKTYQSRPPATARSARRAWGYFTTKYPKRKIKTLCYSPNLDYAGPGWIAEWDIPARDLEEITKCWGSAYDMSWMQGTAHCHQIVNE